MTRRHWKMILVFGLAGLAFEFTAFSDFDGARADDLKMLEATGGAASGAFPPPNIVFIFDTSGSMNNLICDDLSTGSCDGANTTRAGPNGSQICYNTVLAALTGLDKDQDGTADPYIAPFASDGFTWQRHSIYPVYDVRSSSTTDDTFFPGTTLTHSDNNAWSTRETGTGTTDWEKIEDAIDRECGRLSSCNQRSRCVYSMRTQGYFWEDGCSPSGDPLNMCSGSSSPTNLGLGKSCTDDAQCTGTWECWTGSGPDVCSTCDTDGDCGGAAGACTISVGCAHRHCWSASCTVTLASLGTAGAACTVDNDCQYALICASSGTCAALGVVGAACGADSDCESGLQCVSSVCAAPGGLGDACSADSDCDGTFVCKSSVCSNCVADSDCTGATNLCVNTGCSHYYCGETGACRPGADQQLPGNTGSSSSTYVFLGDFLNFYPPKSYTLIKAFTETVENMGADTRIGVSTFGYLSGGDINYRIDGDCTEALSTDCLDVTTTTVCFDPDASALRTWLYTSLSFGGSTPLARALDNVGAYYADSSAAAPENPICDYSSITGLCIDGNVDNFAVLISDGLPNSDASTATDVPFTNGKVGMSNGYYAADSDWVDDVAHALSEIDHRTDLDGDQFVNTYTVSFGLLNADGSCAGVMEEAAVAGGGQCFPADSADNLRKAFTAIILQIQKKIHGFAAPATSATRRTDSTSLSAALFRPSIEFPLWEGHIFGLQVCDESLNDGTDDCDCPVVGETVCVVDANGGPVTYDTEGYMSSEPFWDAQLCLSKDPSNPPPGGLGPDQGGVDTTSCYLSPANRNITTVVDSDADGDLDTNDTQIDFSVANVSAGSALLTALDVGGVVADGQEVVNFFRGYDTGDYDGDGDSTEPRNLKTMLDASSTPADGWWVLGEIFHSIPNVVARPDGRGMGSWARSASYRGFQTLYDDRIKTMVVGANDGMLHAFHTGAWNSTDEVYDFGLGKELWAFVSPELLDDLKDICDPTIPGGCGIGNHRYLVDGSVMVRDIWTGTYSDDKNDDANKTKWRTVAIYGHRRGGTTYVALDVTDIENPEFLWQFPQPGTPEALQVAQTWLDVFPAPASIGPMMVEDGASNVYDRWVALLSGGYDPTDTTGNALFIVDAFTGEKIWSVTKTASGADTDAMNYSFPATPVFYAQFGGYPLIAGIVAADHGGQLWHIPVGNNVLDLTAPSLTPEIVFRAVASPIAPDGHGGDGDGEIDPDEYQTRSFFFAPTLTWFQSNPRVIIGTGDRDHMVPYGALPPSDGSYGTACTADSECAVDCHNMAVSGKRCSECHNDDDCTAAGTGTCESAGCLYQYCSATGCAVPLETTGLDPDVNTMICEEPGRIYSVTLSKCPDGSGGYRPCTESDLVQVNAATATAAAHGWYYVLDPGEKVATPFEILGGYGMYTTFYPTAGCNRGGDICSADSRGDARLYARHYVSGRALDWDRDGTITAGEAVVDLGSGVPTAPAVSVAVSGGEATPSLMAGGSDTGLQARSAAGLATQMAREILRFPVSKKIHNLLH